MLNFLHNRPDEASPKASGIARQPSRAYGVSMQSPTEFSNLHTMMHPGSYVNPHLEYDENRVTKMTDRQKGQLRAEWTKKSNINLIEGEKVVNLKENEDGQILSHYHENHRRELKKNGTRFRLTKGQFSSFVQTQRKNESLGPIEGQERTLERAQQTRRSVLQNSLSSLQKLRSDGSNFSIYKTSSLYKEKGRVRRSRDQLYSSFKLDVESRRYNKSPDFQLPRVVKRPYVTERSTKITLNLSNFNTIDLSRLPGYRI